MSTKLLERCAMGSGRSPKHIQPRCQGSLSFFHKFTKLSAQSVALYRRPVIAAKCISHKGLSLGGIKENCARKRTRANVCPFLANPDKGRTALDSADQALSL